jgi:hypothetical protein
VGGGGKSGFMYCVPSKKELKDWVSHGLFRQKSFVQNYKLFAKTPLKTKFWLILNNTATNILFAVFPTYKAKK